MKKRAMRRNIPLDTDEILMDSVSALGVSETFEGNIEHPLRRLSFLLLLSLMALSFLYMGSRAFSLQVRAGDDFYTASEENRFVTRYVEPPRGMIFDRAGEVLATNVPSFGVLFEKSDFLKADESLSLVVERLGEALEKQNSFFFALGFPEDYDARLLPSEIRIMSGETAEDFLPVVPRLQGIPGVRIVEEYKREYTYPVATAHVLGFTGAVSSEDLREYSELNVHDRIGKDGIERFYDDELRGAGGRKIIEVDSAGHETRYKLTRVPADGLDIELTLDGELQQKIYEILHRVLGSTTGSSAVMLDVRSGAVRALVSYPGFSSNQFGSSLTADAFASIIEDPLKPLFNRVISGTYPSGSTIKPILAAAALEEELVDPTEQIFDPGYIEIPNPYNPDEVTRFLDWKQHGWIDFYDAIAHSANVYFYRIGGGYEEQEGLGIERIGQYTRAFGLGNILGVDLPGESAGVIPDPEYKKEVEPHDPIWRVGDTYNTSIGQGGVRVTPLQITSAIGVIANDGTLWQPFLLNELRTREGRVDYAAVPHALRSDIISSSNLEKVREGMRRTVTEGTARRLADLPVAVAAKTGTAETGTRTKPHAWVTVFAPADDPEIALTVQIEHAGEGATEAMPITREILEWYFEHRNVQ